jgi:ferric-dicitrate binding protein FerR (iron transport regulator)
MNAAARLLALAAIAFAALASAAGAQSADKVLTNVKGSVGYQHDGTAHALVPSVKHSLVDNDYATTQTASQAQVALPDSSLVTLGADTRVQMAFFNQTDVANAKFIIYQGKTRFEVVHPAGQQSNYVFTTPTSNVAVRGTEGDIDVEDNDLTVNVYNSNTQGAPPVQVTFTQGDKAGTTVSVLPGQSLVAKLVNGIIQSQVNALTQEAIDKFAELGVPTNIQQAQNAVINRVKSAIHLPF